MSSYVVAIGNSAANKISTQKGGRGMSNNSRFLITMEMQAMWGTTIARFLEKGWSVRPLKSNYK